MTLPIGRGWPRRGGCFHPKYETGHVFRPAFVARYLRVIGRRVHWRADEGVEGMLGRENGLLDEEVEGQEEVLALDWTTQ